MAKGYKGDGAKEVPKVPAREAQITRRWKRELRLAKKRDKDYVSEGEKIYKRYRGDEKKRNRYNVLWANTDILRPALYNSKPDPDVRRRFRDSDPIGKAVGEVLERSLYVMCDGDSTDDVLKHDVLDGLLPGRGVSRVLYVPKLAPAGQTSPKPAPADKERGDPSGEDASDIAAASKPTEPGEGDYEQLEYEQAILQHVDWKDFRHGYGRTWDEVPWAGFRHQLDKPDATGKFGAAAIKGLQFAPQEIQLEDKREHEDQASVTKVAEFWEIWDKEGGEVFFLNDTLEGRLFPKDNAKGEPPLELEGFFPCPKPLSFVEDSSSLVPIPLFRYYEDEANQLDILTGRINLIIKGLKLRGIYDSKLSEIPDLLTGDDNQLTPVQNAQQWADAGGLEKAIAWMPIDQAVKVLEQLMIAREKQKAIVDELTGISDIVRGVTDPDETLGAQKMKGGYFSIRLWNMQQEVKRYGRDLLRLAAQVMAQRFGIDTFQAMTDLKLPTNADRQALQAKLALAMQPPPMLPPPGAAPPNTPPPPGPPTGPPGASPAGSPSSGPTQTAGAPPPVGGAPPPNPQLLQLQQLIKVPTWEEVIGLLRSPALRQFRVDVETDSMIAGTLESDMSGLSEVLHAIAEALTGLAPLVQSGSLPIDAAKELVMTVIRRARMGTAVEDAFDKLSPPKPPQQPQDTRVQAAQAKGQSDQAIAGIQAQSDQLLEQMKQQGENNRIVLEQHMKTQREQLLEANKTQRDEMTAKFDAFVKIIVATITATKQPDQAVQGKADALVGGTSQADVDPSTTLANPSGAAQ